MKKLASLLMWLVLFNNTRTQYGLETDFDIHEFKQAVAQAYNASKSFSQNYYELLGLICPESVYCRTNGTFETEDAEFRDLVNEETLDIGDFLQNYDQTAISEARKFVQENAQYLKICCEPCSCDNDCRERQNCCSSIDLHSIKSEGLESTELITQECVFANIKHYIRNSANKFTETHGASFFMVNDCASKNLSNDDDENKCTNPDPEMPDQTTPVYSTGVKKIYTNIFCARCNDISPVTAMASVISISHTMSLTESIRLPGSPYELYRIAVKNPRFFDISYTFPRKRLNIGDFDCVYVPPFLRPDSSQCDKNQNLDNNQRYLFTRGCGLKEDIVYMGMKIFTNVFCLLCYPYYMYTDQKPVCRRFEMTDRNDGNSFSALLTSSLPKSNVHPDVKKDANERCDCAEMFDTSKKVCREILCPPGEIRDVCDCVPFIDNLTGMRIRLHLEIRQQLPNPVSNNRICDEKDPAAIAKSVTRLVASKFGPLSSDAQSLFCQSAVEEKATETFLYMETLTLKDAFVERGTLQSMFKTLQAGLTRKIVGTQMKVSLGRILNLDSTSSVDITGTAFGSDGTLDILFPGPKELRNKMLDIRYSQPLKKLIYCERVKLDEDEVEMLSNITEAAGWSQTYLDYVYWEEDGSMCLEDFEAAFMPGSTSGARSYMSAATDCHINLLSASQTVSTLIFVIISSTFV